MGGGGGGYIFYVFWILDNLGGKCIYITYYVETLVVLLIWIYIQYHHIYIPTKLSQGIGKER